MVYESYCKYKFVQEPWHQYAKFMGGSCSTNFVKKHYKPPLPKNKNHGYATIRWYTMYGIIYIHWCKYST